jgi:hypothetical protein
MKGQRHDDVEERETDDHDPDGDGVGRSLAL